MRTFRSSILLGILAILVLTPSCSRSSSGGGNRLPTLATILVWNPPAKQYLVPRKASLPRTLETLTLEHTGTTGDVEYKIEDPTGSLAATPASGVLRPGERVAVTIATIKLVAYTTVTVNMTLGYVDNGTVDPLNVALAFALMPPAMYVMSVLTGDPRVPSMFLDAIVFGKIGVIVLHSTGLPARHRVPALPFTEIVLIGMVTLGLTAPQLQSNFWPNKTSQSANVTFPLGEGPIGYTLHANKEVDMAAGEYHMFHMMMREPIPIEDPDDRNLHTYSFVIDSDGNAANNLRPSLLEPNDSRGGTDRWYEVHYSNKDGWSLKVSQVDSNQQISEVASAARVVIVDDAVVLVVPKSEIPGPDAKWRSSSFVHQGDRGFAFPYAWSGDVEPPVAKPLVQIK